MAIEEILAEVEARETEYFNNWTYGEQVDIACELRDLEEKWIDESY